MAALDALLLLADVADAADARGSPPAPPRKRALERCDLSAAAKRHAAHMEADISHLRPFTTAQKKPLPAAVPGYLHRHTPYQHFLPPPQPMLLSTVHGLRRVQRWRLRLRLRPHVRSAARMGLRCVLLPLGHGLLREGLRRGCQSRMRDVVVCAGMRVTGR